ncbi:MAG: GNAT family N-acetyltransferase [Steroidobacteraceae bacterium]|nr:GNAT family N-acetyltransferase [Steroidobacteraceae bacterium]
MSGQAQRGSWPRAARTPAGVDYRIRPIRKDDAARERTFILDLSPASRFQRLMYTVREPSDEFIAHLVDVDQQRSMALVATTGDGDAERFIGVARYAADESGRDCEFAVAVSDDWQCRGIGTTLTQLLFDYAREKGFRTIYGTVLADNRRMIELAEWLGLTVEPRVPGELTVRIARRLD